MLSDDDVDALVTRVHEQYDACKFKPSNDYQYTVLAAFVLESPSDTSRFKVVSLATGAKCLPTTRYPPRGDALHDSHAEILARRAFVRWLYEEVQRADWIEQCEDGKQWRRRLKEGVKLHMYISTVPCFHLLLNVYQHIGICVNCYSLARNIGGDASMRFLASSQDPEMAALKDAAPPVPPPPGAASRGRDGYSLYGVLRTKPGRADSPPTLCMSCSDKIAVFNVLGVQGALASTLFLPIYLSDIVIGDVPQQMHEVVKEDCERAFYGRLSAITDLPEPFYLATPALHFTNLDFTYSRTRLQSLNSEKPPPPSSNESLCWVADSATGDGQVIINGIRRGVGPKQCGLEKFRPRLCKLQLFRLHQETVRAIGPPTFPPSTTYYSAKQSDSSFRIARDALKGASGPFTGWLVSGKKWESFDIEGNDF